MSKDKTSGAQQMRSLYAAGDVKAARAHAWTVLHDPAAAEDDKALAAKLRENTEVDRRGLGIGLAALAFAVLVVAVYLVA